MRTIYYIAATMLIAPSLALAQSYDDLARHPSAYMGAVVSFQGKVVQAVQSGNRYVLRVNVTRKPYDIWSDTVLVEFRVAPTSSDRLLEDDVINLRGRFAGIKSYKAVLGQTIQIPSVVACEISDANSTFRSAPTPCNSDEVVIGQMSRQRPRQSSPAHQAVFISRWECRQLRLSVCSTGSDTCTNSMSPEQCDKFLNAREDCEKQGWWNYDACPQPRFYDPYRRY
jgi:hypothetical protein